MIVLHLHYFLPPTKLELYKCKTTVEKEGENRHLVSLNGQRIERESQMDDGGIYVTLYMISSFAFPIVYINKISVSIVQQKL